MNMYHRNRLINGFMLIVIVLAQSACANAAASANIHQIGESVEIQKDVILTLKSWDMSADQVNAYFTIQNKGTEKFLMRGFFSILHQQKGKPDLAPLPFVKLTGPAQNCASTLYGDIAPGENWSGTVCWEGLRENGITYPVQMKYSLHKFDLFRGSVAVWKVSEHTVGEAIPIKDGITITMDRTAVSPNGNSLQADFTVENHSAEQFYIEGAFSMQYSIAATGGLGGIAPSMNGCGSALLGYIQSGQKMSGNVCWSDLDQYDISFPARIKYGWTSQGNSEIIWVVDQ